jgi:hypothetical protein
MRGVSQVFHASDREGPPFRVGEKWEGKRRAVFADYEAMRAFPEHTQGPVKIETAVSPAVRFQPAGER